MADHLVKVNCEQGAGNIISAFTDFLFEDWFLSAGEYLLDVSHNLESEVVNTFIWENGKDQVGVDRVEIINSNVIRLHVTYDPDTRFSGRIVIFKI